MLVPLGPPPGPTGGPHGVLPPPPGNGNPNNQDADDAVPLGPSLTTLPEFANPATTPHRHQLCNFVQALHAGDLQHFIDNTVAEIAGVEAILGNATGAVTSAHALGQAKGPLCFLTVLAVAPGQQATVRVLHCV